MDLLWGDFFTSIISGSPGLSFWRLYSLDPVRIYEEEGLTYIAANERQPLCAASLEFKGNNTSFLYKWSQCLKISDKSQSQWKCTDRAQILKQEIFAPIWSSLQYTMVIKIYRVKFILLSFALHHSADDGPHTNDMEAYRFAFGDFRVGVTEEQMKLANASNKCVSFFSIYRVRCLQPGATQLWPIMRCTTCWAILPV